GAMMVAKTIGSVATIATVLAGAPASAAVEIPELTKVAIEAGKLVIAGKTRVAGQTVKLDGGMASAVSSASRIFGFELVYLPKDCIVDLEVAGTIKNAVVANCGPKGVSPRGAWTSTTSYLIDDLVIRGGSSWRALSNNKGKDPIANPAIW